MIFVTVGTIPQQFNRLLHEVDELIQIGLINEKVFAQTGHSDYKPKNYEYRDLLGLDEFGKRMEEASLIITHGGEGNIGRALQLEKKLVIVPRLKRFGEHTNDHQLEITKAVEKEGRGLAVYEIKRLADAVKKSRAFKPKKSGKAGRIIELIEEFMEREKVGKKDG